eukprot:s747_g16.t1
MIIIDFSPLSSLSQRYRYYAALNRDIYDNLTGYAEQAMWQVTRHLHPNNLDTTRVDDLINMVSHRIMDQWQVMVAPHTLYDFITKTIKAMQSPSSLIIPLNGSFLHADPTGHVVNMMPGLPWAIQISGSLLCPAWRDVVIVADFSEISHLADENWNFSAMHPLNHVPLSMMEEKALWQYTRYVYSNQVDTYTLDHLLSGIAERIEE